MAHFDLSLYETVAQRLVRWWTEYPDGRIITSIHHYDGSTIIMRAECYNNDDRLIATGYAEEVFGNSPVNKTSFLENCETSIGRKIEEQIENINKIGVNKNIQLECDKHGPFEQDIGFDPVNFFTAS